MSDPVRAELSMDPRLIVMLARKQYSMNPLQLLVRELLQNSVDACREQQRVEHESGREFEPEICIRISWHRDETATVICDDNGIGMTAEQFHDNFLRLGKTGKITNGLVGGFGIGAKTAVLSNEKWSVHTLDNFINQDILFTNDFIRKVKPRVGTRIKVSMKDVRFFTLDRAAEMIYLSNVRVHFKATWDAGVLVDDPNAGLKQDLRPLDEAMGYQQSINDVFEIPLQGAVKGYNIFRMHGLVQFCEYYNAGRSTNLWFDFDDQVGVDSPDYPFNMNREGMSKVGLVANVRGLIETHNQNTVSSQKLAHSDKKVEIISVTPGKFIQGKRERTYTKGSQKTSMGSDEDIQFKIRGDSDNLHDPSRKDVALYVRKYNYEPAERDYHVNLLLIWKEIVEICTSDVFALGITQDQGTSAERCEYAGCIFYIINPDVLMRTETARGKILQLWSLACHECAHEAEGAHNERFTSIEGDIYEQTSDEIAEALPRLARRL